jgi:hypothetical protein
MRHTIYQKSLPSQRIYLALSGGIAKMLAFDATVGYRFGVFSCVFSRIRVVSQGFARVGLA